MEKLIELERAEKILVARVGSVRYGYATSESDIDRFYLTKNTDIAYHDRNTNTSYFAWSVQHAVDSWGHPMLMGNLTGECTGDQRLVNFLQGHRREVAYAAPEMSARFGLEYIAGKESSGYGAVLKSDLLTAFILSHMATKAEDPFLLNEEEKAVLTRARDSGIPTEERADIYRRTISPENIDRLMKMPDHPTIKTELFQLIEEVIRQS